MARNKAPKPLVEAPPEPDSSSNEVSGSSSTEVEEDAVSSSSSSEEEDEGTPSTPPPPALPSSAKKPSTIPTVSISKKPISDDSSDDVPLPKLKAISSSKPVNDGSSSKPRSKSTVAALIAEKRPSESEDKGTAKKPRKEKAVSGPIPVVQEEGSKKLFQRVFSEDDEIVILKGMLEYRAKKKTDPMTDVDDFYGFIKKSLHVDVNKGQIVDKVRRLRRKFNNAKKKKLTNLHDIEAFELSKKIWEKAEDDGLEEKISNGVIENDNMAGKSISKPRTVKSKSGNANGGIAEDQKISMEVEEGEKGGKISENKEKEEDIEVGEAVSKEKLRKKGLKKMGAKARAEIDAMWEKVAMEEMKVEMLRLETQQEEDRMIMEALDY